MSLSRQLKMTQDAMCVRYSNTKSQVLHCIDSATLSLHLHHAAPLPSISSSLSLQLLSPSLPSPLPTLPPLLLLLLFSSLLFSLQDKLLVAVGLLDCTVKIFFDDTLKFFLSLYGHKLPVMCLDISYDGNILISGSADKTIKIWGLDFGDCHR